MQPGSAVSAAESGLVPARNGQARLHRAACSAACTEPAGADHPVLQQAAAQGRVRHHAAGAPAPGPTQR